MRNEVNIVYRVKLTGYKIRAMIAILNDQRIKLKANRESTDEINDLILRFLDICEQKAA